MKILAVVGLPGSSTMFYERGGISDTILRDVHAKHDRTRLSESDELDATVTRTLGADCYVRISVVCCTRKGTARGVQQTFTINNERRPRVCGIGGIVSTSLETLRQIYCFGIYHGGAEKSR